MQILRKRKQEPYFMLFMPQKMDQGLEKLWIKTGIRDTSRYVPVHDLADKTGRGLHQVLPVVHTLTGCDYTGKFGTKHAALKANTEKYSVSVYMYITAIRYRE